MLSLSSWAEFSWNHSLVPYTSVTWVIVSISIIYYSMLEARTRPYFLCSSTLNLFKGPCMLSQVTASIPSLQAASLKILLELTIAKYFAILVVCIIFYWLDMLLFWSKSFNKWKNWLELFLKHMSLSPLIEQAKIHNHFKPLSFHWLPLEFWVWLSKRRCHFFMHHSKTFLCFILMLNMEIIFITLAVAVDLAHINLFVT